MPARHGSARTTATATAKATATAARRKERPRKGQTLARGQALGGTDLQPLVIRWPIRAKRSMVEVVHAELEYAKRRWALAVDRYRGTSPMDEEFAAVAQELKAATESYLDHAQKALRVSEKV